MNVNRIWDLLSLCVSNVISEEHLNFYDSIPVQDSIDTDE